MKQNEDMLVDTQLVQQEVRLAKDDSRLLTKVLSNSQTETKAVKSKLDLSSERKTGFYIAQLVHINELGIPFVVVSGVIEHPVEAETMCDIGDSKAGDQFGMMFKNGRVEQPVLMGLIQQPILIIPDDGSTKVTQENDKIQIQAAKEIHLSCGESHLLLTADGHAEIRGHTVVAYSKGLNRIRGASVKIN